MEIVALPINLFMLRTVSIYRIKMAFFKLFPKKCITITSTLINKVILLFVLKKIPKQLVLDNARLQMTKVTKYDVIVELAWESLFHPSYFHLFHSFPKYIEGQVFPDSTSLEKWLTDFGRIGEALICYLIVGSKW